LSVVKTAHYVANAIKEKNIELETVHNKKLTLIMIRIKKTLDHYLFCLFVE